MTTPAFDQFGLNAELVQTAVELGFTAPTPIQQAVIPFRLKEDLPVSIIRMARQYHDEVRHKAAHAAELRELKAC